MLKEYDDSDASGSELEEGSDGDEDNVKQLDDNLNAVLDEFIEESQKRNIHADGVSEDTRKVVESQPILEQDEEEDQYEYVAVEKNIEDDCESVISSGQKMIAND